MASESEQNPLIMLWIYGSIAVFLILYPSSDIAWWKTLLISLFWPIAVIAEFLGLGNNSHQLCFQSY